MERRIAVTAARLALPSARKAKQQKLPPATGLGLGLARRKGERERTRVCARPPASRSRARAERAYALEFLDLKINQLTDTFFDRKHFLAHSYNRPSAFMSDAPTFFLSEHP